jgi:hypothetical protein
LSTLTEITIRGENPRFVVTSLTDDPRSVYEAIYCARGDMENRIKEQQLYLFATRTSGRLMRVNQVRLWLSSVAYVLRGGPRISDRLLRWYPEQEGGVWNATEETEVPT